MIYAGLFRRCLAALIDGIILLLGLRLLGLGEDLTDLFFILPLFFLLYFTLLEGLFGATIGKGLLGVRVIRVQGDKVGLARAFVRNIVRLLNVLLITLLIDLILIWRSSRHQRLGDILAGTTVARRQPASKPLQPPIQAPPQQVVYPTSYEPEASKSRLEIMAGEIILKAEASTSPSSMPMPAPTAAVEAIPQTASQPTTVPKVKPKPGVRWGRLLAGLLVLALAIAVILVPDRDLGRLFSLFTEQAKVVDMGVARYAPPSTDKLVQTKDWGVVPANQLLILLKDGLARKDAERIASGLGAAIVGELEFINFYQLQTFSNNESQLAAIMVKAKSIQGVELAFPHLQGSLRDGPTPTPAPAPPQQGKQPGAIAGTRCNPLDNAVYRHGANSRHYEMIGLGEAWDLVRASGVALNKVHVGVVDEALDTKAGDVHGKSKIYGLRAQDSENRGFLTHGTMVTNVIGADLENGGVVGVASVLGENLAVSVTNTQDTSRDSLALATPDSSDPTKIDTGWGVYSFKYFVDIQKQIESGATIINASWGARWVGPWQKDMNATWHKFLVKMNKEHPQVLFVNAAGNSNDALDGHNDWLSGQNLPNVMTVAALDNQGKKASFSSYATGSGEVTLATPAEEMVVAMGFDGKPFKESGTSFAAPQVVGAAAILRSLNPKLTAADIKKILVETGAPGVPGKDKSGNDISVPVPKEVGGKVLRVDNAVLKVINDMRQEKGLPPIDRETLEKLAAIDVAATSNRPLEYTIRATVSAVGPNGADVTIAQQGRGTIGGLSKQHLNGPGAVTWGFTFIDNKDSVGLTVRRLDTNGCATLTLKPDGSPTPTPAAEVTKRPVIDIMKAVLQRLGYQWKDWDPNKSPTEPGGYLMCQSDAGSEACYYYQVDRVPGSGEISQALRLRLASLNPGMLAQAEAGNNFNETYRGVKAARDSTDNAQRGPGSSWSAIRKFTVMSGTVLVIAERDSGCSPDDPKTGRTVKACPGLSAPKVPTIEVDAALEEAVKGGLIPPDTLK